MTNLYVQESFINKTEGYRFGDSDVYESFCDTPGEVYRYGLKEYGRCTGKVYVGDGVHVGWVFEGRQRYEDTGEPYVRQVWVTVHDAPETVTRERHYHAIGKGARS